MSTHCHPRQRQRAHRTAAHLRDAAPDAAVIVVEASSTRWGRWAVAATLPNADALPPAVLRALAATDARVRNVRTNGEGAHVVCSF